MTHYSEILEKTVLICGNLFAAFHIPCFLILLIVNDNENASPCAILLLVPYMREYSAHIFSRIYQRKTGVRALFETTLVLLRLLTNDPVTR